MSFEAEVLKYVKVDPQVAAANPLAFLVDPMPDLIAKEVETILLASPPIPSGIPVHQKFAHYTSKTSSAFNDALVSLGQKGILASWQLTGSPLPSVDKGNGVWEYRDGVSVQMTKVAQGFTGGPPIGVGVDYYLSVHPPMSAEDDARECTFCFPNDTGLEATGIVLFLTHTRTQILSIERVGGHSNARLVSRGTDTIWDLHWRGNVPDGPVCFKVRFLGDPPFFRAHTWISPRAKIVEAPRVGPFEDPPRAVSPRHVGHLVQFERTFGEELAHYGQQIGVLGTHVQAREFFRELDETTNPKALPPQQGMPIAMLGSYLALRYNVRAELVHFGESTAYLPAELSSWESIAKPVAEHVRDLLRSHFKGNQNGVDRRAVNDAFEKFAGGELTVFETHGAPNGVNFFAFAELAILLTEMGLEPEFWEPLIEIFGRTAEIYAGSYHACFAGRTHCAYQVSNNPDGSRRPDDATKAALRKQWSGADAKAEFDRIVHSALFDDQLAGPATTPFSVLDDWGCGVWP